MPSTNRLALKTANRFALKEWAAVCAALESGRQCLLLRKGGIDEGRQGFRVEHDEFWLYPTQFHQSADQLASDAAALAPLAERSAPPLGRLHLRLYATVEHVSRVDRLEDLLTLSALHILSPSTVESRFHYRTPGLFVLLTRIYALPQPHDLVERPGDAGCRSWVTLADDLSTGNAVPVVSDERFAELSAEYHRLLG